MTASRFLKLTGLCMMVGLLACAQPDPPAPEREGGAIELGEVIEWTAIEGAVEYRVQLWAGQRLLFEEVREQNSLPVTPVMRRSLLGVDRAELQVRATGPDGRPIGTVERREYPSGGG